MANFPSDSHRFEGLGSLTIQFFFLKDYIYIQLVGGLEHDFYDFSYMENVINPADFHYIFFSEG